MANSRPPRLGPSAKPGLKAAFEAGRWPVPLQESAATAVVPSLPRTAVHEAATVIGSAGHPGRLKIALIRSGWSLNSAFYPAEVLKRDGASAWPAGKTLCYIDHATDAEEEDYPSGSIKNLAAVLTTDAQWNEATQQLEAEVRLFAPWREAITDMAEHIGMSIRAWVYGEDGEAEGRKGFLVNSIVEGRSVDFVTVPAAGGAILSVLESVRHGQVREARNVGGWLESRLHLAATSFADDMYGDGRLTRDERITLSGAIGDGLQAWTGRVQADAPQLYQRSPWEYPEDATTATESARRLAEATVEERRAALAHEIAEMYGDAETYTWVRDFDPDVSLVWFDTCPRDGDNSTWQQAYTVADDGTVALDGDRVEVIPRTVYDPAPAEDEPADGIAEAVVEPAPPTAVAVEEDVTDGAPPTVTDPPIEEETGMSGTQTGSPPVQAGTAPVVDTPPATSAAEAIAANTAVLEAMQALTRQVTALTEANTALTDRANRRDAEDRTARNRQTAREAVTVALSAPEVPADLREQIGPRVTAVVLADLPTTEAGDLDPAALAEAITAAIGAESGYAARLLESAGVGRPRGLGSQPIEAQTADQFEASMAESFVALGMSAEAAKIAARGRG